MVKCIFFFYVSGAENEGQTTDDEEEDDFIGVEYGNDEVEEDDATHPTGADTAVFYCTRRGQQCHLNQ